MTNNNAHGRAHWAAPRRWRGNTWRAAVLLTALSSMALTSTGTASASTPTASIDGGGLLKVVLGGTDKPLKVKWGDDDTHEGAKASELTGKWDAGKDHGSLYSLTGSIGAQQAWAMKDASGRRITGTGVTVAVIDTGVAPVDGLNVPGKVINGPDLSFE